MLVLTRGIDEAIMIGDNIRVTVVRITGGVIRIGVEAPKETSVLRSEHFLRHVDGVAHDQPPEGK